MGIGIRLVQQALQGEQGKEENITVHDPLIISAIKKLLAEKSAEHVPGGKASGKPDSKYDPAQIAMGVKVEKEHTDDPAAAKEIAKDHLEEFGNYYTALKKMEHRLEAKKASVQLLRMHKALLK